MIVLDVVHRIFAVRILDDTHHEWGQSQSTVLDGSYDTVSGSQLVLLYHQRHCNTGHNALAGAPGTTLMFPSSVCRLQP